MPVQHSKIIGFSYDSCPIYGKYGYINSVDSNSQIVEITSSYRLKSTISPSRPPITIYPIGSFAEDYEFDHTGMLDKHNGRFMITPEYPKGIYAYVATSEFPYFIGDTYKHINDTYNNEKKDNNVKIPYDSVRVIQDTTNNQLLKSSDKLGDNIIEISELSKGSLNNVKVEVSGYDYSIGDNIIFDTKNNSPIAEVSWLHGKSCNMDILGSDVFITTTSPHLLTSEDIIKVLPPETKSTNIIDLTISNNLAIRYNDDNIHKIIVPQNNNYDNFSIYLSEDPDGDIVYTDLYIKPYTNQFNINCKSILIYPNANRPKLLFLNLVNKTNTISLNCSLVLEKTSYLGLHTVTVVSEYIIKYKILNQLSGNTVDIKYITNSKTATGGIYYTHITYPGTNLPEIPKISHINTKTGYGAILIPESSNIGIIKSVDTINSGERYISDPTIKYNFNSDTVLKLKYNNTIDSLKILNGGANYLIAPLVETPNTNIELYITSGIVTSGSITNGGNYYENTPELIINNTLTGGNGAVVIGLLKKANIPNNLYIYYGTSIQNAAVKARIVHYDINASTIQVTCVVGAFSSISDDMYIWDEIGNKLGKISEIIKSEISSKCVNSKNITNTYNISSSTLTRTNVLHDNNKYQAYSYTIFSQHDLIDYKNIVNVNTHPTGLKLTAIRELTNIIQLYIRSQNKIKNSISFRVILNDLLKLPLHLNFDKLYIYIHSNLYNNYKNTQFAKKLFDFCYYDDNYVYTNYKTFNHYTINDKIWLTDTYYRYIRKIINPYKALTSGQTIIKFSINTNANNTNSLLTYAGILQHPGINYNAYNRIIELFSEILYTNDSLVLRTYNTDFIFTDTFEIVNDTANLFVDNNSYYPANINNSILVLNGIPIKPTELTIINNIITLSNLPNHTNTGFLIYNPNLVYLEITQINNQVYSVTNISTLEKEKIILVVNGIVQSNQLFSVINDKIVFSGNFNIETIFGWYVDTQIANIETTYEIVSTTNPTNLVDADITPIFKFGKLVNFIINNSGYNYPEFLELKIINTNGQNAYAVCQTEHSRITNIKIIYSGTGYSVGKVRISQLMYIETAQYPIILNQIGAQEALPAIIGNIIASPQFVEIGSLLTSVLLNWNVSRIPSTSITITDLINVDKTITNNSITLDYTNNPITTNKIYTMTVLDNTDVYTYSSTIEFLFKVYTCKSPFNVLNNTQIINLSANTANLQNTKNGTYTWNTLVNDYIYIAYPLSFGLSNFQFIDFVVTFDSYTITNFVNASGYVVEYIVYKSLNQLNGTVTIEIT